MDGSRLDAHARGVLGEVRAEQELTRKGYRIVARNVALRGAEIDLVALDGGVLTGVQQRQLQLLRLGEGAAQGGVEPDFHRLTHVAVEVGGVL